MFNKLTSIGLLCVSLMISLPGMAWEPVQTIKVIVPYKEGGATDMCAKAMLIGAEKYIQQKVVIEYVEGEAGVSGIKKLVDSKPDGYTLAYVNLPTFAVRAYLPGAYYRVSDVVPICNQNTETAIIIVPSDSPFKGLDELVDYAKNNAFTLRAATNGEKSSYHTAIQLFATNSHFTYKPIHYDGTVNQVEAMLEGKADFACVSYAEVAHLYEMKRPKIRILGVFSDKRLKYLPHVATLGEYGYYDKWYGTLRGIVAPHGVSDEIVEYYSDIFGKIFSDPEVISEHNKRYLQTDYKDHLNFEAVITAIDYRCRNADVTIYDYKQ